MSAGVGSNVSIKSIDFSACLFLSLGPTPGALAAQEKDDDPVSD